VRLEVCNLSKRDLQSRDFTVGLNRFFYEIILYVVIEFGKRHDTTDTTDICRFQLVTDLLRGETGVIDFGVNAGDAKTAKLNAYSNDSAHTADVSTTTTEVVRVPAASSRISAATSTRAINTSTFTADRW